jgi:hypothetical protein
MFSSRTPRLFAAALMDLAEAMLRPVDVSIEEQTAAHSTAEADATRTSLRPSRRLTEPSWLSDDEPFGDARPPRTPPSPHPHRRATAARPVSTRRRRPGAVAPATAACTTPLSTARRAPSRAATARG